MTKRMFLTGVVIDTIIAIVVMVALCLLVTSVFWQVVIVGIVGLLLFIDVRRGYRFYVRQY